MRFFWKLVAFKFEFLQHLWSIGSGRVFRKTSYMLFKIQLEGTYIPPTKYLRIHCSLLTLPPGAPSVVQKLRQKAGSEWVPWDLAGTPQKKQHY